MKIRREEMDQFQRRNRGQKWETYVGHAIQIRQQAASLDKCIALYTTHNPPCCDPSTPPYYNPFPLPAWKPQKLPWWAKGGKSVDDIISGTGKVLVYSGAAVIVGVGRLCNWRSHNNGCRCWKWNRFSSCFLMNHQIGGARCWIYRNIILAIG